MKLLLPVLIITVLIFGYFVLTKNNPNINKISLFPLPRTSDEMKTFQSRNLKFDLRIPSNFNAGDEPSRITINSSQGQIYVNRSGTQFKNLDSYLRNFDQTTSLKTDKDEELQINDLQARVRVLKNSDASPTGEEKIYFIHVDNFVYKISTSEVALFDILDQIAQSFRYTP